MTNLRPTAFVNARVLDPASGRLESGGVFVDEGVIVEFGAGVTQANVGARTHIIDCGGDVVSPGLIDMRAFVGEPGATHRETIASASAANARSDTLRSGSNRNSGMAHR